jgi:hypothetical protein
MWALGVKTRSAPFIGLRVSAVMPLSSFSSCVLYMIESWASAKSLAINSTNSSISTRRRTLAAHSSRYWSA